ncbi:uncharacterized protein K489DRAFT_377433 [Dissoconium aciculare CBS 342.82]|uniref:Conserved oligomeric Golgi complex subunit 5 n=1 Tax=Dissoconium aciculare CBS 342.82 TaxID=1314786 RepID=A0A6J3MAK4_9PEZI|nr:uncharacterized protein K489DRAFT_377433 [Dissoconium aciculare CBS 342.82]KAF1824893.1 hypothetical protein K489DRAFT_377433 [Dissoconium aciculare CBS 342.82]
MTTSTTDSAYLNFPTLLDPAFSPSAYANDLVLATNNPSDTTIDLSTPLSRVLFDAQEVDTHIDTLTTQYAGPIIDITQSKADASAAVLETVEAQVAGLKESYERLQREVVDRWESAEQVRLVAERLVEALRLGRKVLRCLQLARQLESSVAEGRMVGAAETILDVREVFTQDPHIQLDRVKVVASVRADVLVPMERAVVQRAQGVVKEFSMSGLLAATAAGQSSASSTNPALTSTYARTEETKSRASQAIHTLYLLSPVPKGSKSTVSEANEGRSFEPTLLLAALTSYLQISLSSSTASLARALANLPGLDRTLLEISARCQNLVALETLLASLQPPIHPSLPSPARSLDEDDGDDSLTPANLLAPLLRHLDTASLPSYFWRSLASAMPPRVNEVLNKGGSTARTLRASRDRLREMLRECVERGSRLPGTSEGRRTVGEGAGGTAVANWEREAAVMVGSVVGSLGR